MTELLPTEKAADNGNNPEQTEFIGLYPQRTFEDLTLGEALARLIRHPVRTWAGLSQTLKYVSKTDKLSGGSASGQIPSAAIVDDAAYRGMGRALEAQPLMPSAAIGAGFLSALIGALIVIVGWNSAVVVAFGNVFLVCGFGAAFWVMRRSYPELLPITSIGLAFLVTLIGSIILTSARGSAANSSLPVGGAYLFVGFLLMIAALARNVPLERIPALEVEQPADRESLVARDIISTYGLRILLIGMAIVWTLGTWVFNSLNRFTAIGVFCWVMSIITWTVALMDRGLPIDDWLTRIRQALIRAIKHPFSIPVSWSILIMVGILVVGAWLRFSGLGLYPPEMTSDHVEKALDTLAVYEGDRSIFFPNNGGREAFQMYFLAALKAVTNLPADMILLQIGSGLEGMLMIAMAWWMGRALIGEEDRELGNLTGLIMAAMVAVSFWHVVLSRLGLRIVTTTFVTTFVFVYLIRALRYNRRTDFVITGLALGASVYFYQSMRLLPIVVVVGFVLALILRSRSRIHLRQYAINLLVLIVVAVIVFVPLARYMIQYPQDFWSRATGRLTGLLLVGEPREALNAFQQNLPRFGNNVARSLLMYNWKGDASWFNGSPDGTPELDFFTGTMFILGLAFVGWRIIRRRDPLDGLLPIGIVIMVLPAASAIAYPNEVPSLTRASGSFPMVYLIAALALAFIIRYVARHVPQRRLRFAVYASAVILFVLSAFANSNAYFVRAMADYRNSTQPHRQVGQIMRGFFGSTGAPGNVYLSAYEHWWDYRAIAIEAGVPHLENLIWRHEPGLRANLIATIRKNIDGPYSIMPDRQLMFFANPADTEWISLLGSMFPLGTMTHVASYKPTKDFIVFTVPAVGCEWVEENVGAVPESCNKSPVPSDQVEFAPTPVPPQ